VKINQAQTASIHFHEVVQPNSGTMHAKILETMEIYIRKPDWTISELADTMQMDKSSISGRRNEMLKLYLLERGEKRRCNITNVLCETVKIKRPVNEH